MICKCCKIDDNNSFSRSTIVQDLKILERVAKTIRSKTVKGLDDLPPEKQHLLLRRYAGLTNRIIKLTKEYDRTQ